MANIDKNTIKGIIFDYGGTLDTRGDHWSHILAEGWRHAGVEVDEATFRDCYVHAERTLARQRVILPGDDFATLLRKKVEIELSRLAEITGTPVANLDEKAAAIAGYCDDYARRCVGEARPVLEALSQRYPMVLVSNFYGNVDEVVRTYGLRGYFGGIIESAVVGVRKPDARIFMLGVVALGLKPEEVLVVGDSLKKDILPARSIGCRTAWIKGRGWTADEDAADDAARIEGLGSLLALLD